MSKMLRVDKAHERVQIYDKLGSGYIELTENEAEFVKERLEEVLEE